VQDNEYFMISSNVCLNLIRLVCGSKLTRCKWRDAGTSNESKPSPAREPRVGSPLSRRRKLLKFIVICDWNSDPSVRWPSVSDRSITRHDSSPVNGPILFCRRCCSVFVRSLMNSANHTSGTDVATLPSVCCIARLT
jgi:hypothetical protein